jgi:hypothetical protein
VNGSVTIRRLAHPIVIAGNTHLNPSADGYVPAISGNRALAIGLADVSLHPSSTVATLVVDSTGTPIWIVAFHGVCVASHGGSGPCNTEMNVAVSARSGAVLFEFSYR